MVEHDRRAKAAQRLTLAMQVRPHMPEPARSDHARRHGDVGLPPGEGRFERTDIAPALQD